MSKNPMQSSLTDTNHQFWQTAAIIGVPIGITSFAMGGLLFKEFGINTAIPSFFVGNLILWVIGLAVITMASQEHKRAHAIDNVIEYFGTWTGLLFSVILVSAIIIWYTLQLNSFTKSLEGYLSQHFSNPSFLRIGAGFGLITALLASRGIRLIKITCLITFPLLVLGLLVFASKSTFSPDFSGPFILSLPAIILSIAHPLAGFVNLPTIMRHSKTKADAFLALSLIVILAFLFESASFWISGGFSSLIMTFQNDVIPSVLILICISLAILCINLVNVYLASASWETISRRSSGPKLFAIIGLAGTATYILLQDSTVMLLIKDIATIFIACLGVVLTLSFLVRIIVRHRTRSFDKLINNFCWLIGCLVAIRNQFNLPEDTFLPLLRGIGTSLILFLIIIFFEETIWAIKNLRKSKKSVN